MSKFIDISRSLLQDGGSELQNSLEDFCSSCMQMVEKREGEKRRMVGRGGEGREGFIRTWGWNKEGGGVGEG